MKKEKLLNKLIRSPHNIRFADMQKVVTSYGFRLDRINGSHHIYVRSGINELVNIQNVKGKVKPYQIKQFLSIVERNNLQTEE